MNTFPEWTTLSALVEETDCESFRDNTGTEVVHFNLSASDLLMQY